MNATMSLPRGQLQLSFDWPEDQPHPCLGRFEKGKYSHRGYCFNDGSPIYCERCGELLTPENFSNLKRYVK